MSEMDKDTRTLTLTGFLLARIAEDEAAARAAQPEVWYSDYRNVMILGDDNDEDFVCQVTTKADAKHIARHDPARVLAECEAKRYLIAFAFKNAAVIDGDWGCGHSADRIRTGAVPDECCGPDVAQQVLAPLALPYADHPDYRQEWTP